MPTSVEKTAEVVIIGGGVMGASTAFHLAQRGVKDVVLLEKKYLASGPTGRSLAQMRPYQEVEETLKVIKKANDIYLNFSEIVGGDAQFRRIGRIWAEPESKRPMLDHVTGLCERAGIQTERLSLKDVGEMLPGLVTEGLVAAAYFPDAGYCNPGAVTTSFATRAHEMGVAIHEETEVTGIEVSGGKVQSVTCTQGTVSTPAVVNAAGIWSRNIGRMVGIDIPITPTRAQVVTFRLPWNLPPFTPIFADGRTEYVFRCEPGNLIQMIDTLEIVEPEVVDPDTIPDNPDHSTMVKALEEGPKSFPALKHASFRGGLSCAYDLTPDGSPVIEEAPGVRGLFNLIGWSGLGLQQGPVAGELMAELITTGKTTLIDVSVFSARRFKEGRALASAWVFGEG